MTNRFDNFDFPLSVGNSPLPGTLLVASPALKETPFHRAVVLVLQNNSQGTFGVTLNRPADEDMRSAWEQMTGIQAEDPILVQGGPINGPVFAIHREPELADHEVAGGVFVCSETDKFLELSQQATSDYRIVFGVAGWQVGQLQQEIEMGYWLPISNQIDFAFEPPRGLWARSMRLYGQQLLTDVVGVKNFPSDPLQN